MKFTSSTYNVGYPVYGSKFLNDTMLLVAGGGGEGNNGIPNKLTVLRVDFEKKKIVKRFREITLDPNDDSPTTLDAANNLILMGCNENSEKIKSGGGNQSLRKFVYENEHLKYMASVDFDGFVSPEDYTKLISMSRDGSVGAIASSKVPTVIRIIDPRNLEEKYEIETGHDVKDMHFAPDGKVIGYITASTLEVISIVTGRFIIRKNDFDKNYILSKVRFLTDDVVLIAASLQRGSGVILIKISLKSGSATVLKTKMVTNKFKGLTSMDVDMKNQLAVIAGNDNSIALVKLKDFSLGRMFKQVHSFAITRVAFSPDSKLVASVSAANTVNVIKIPDNFALSSSLASKIWKLFVNFVLVVIIAFLGQLSYRHNLHDKCYRFLKHQYLARRNGPDGGIDILKQTTLVGDIVSEMTTTMPFDTTKTVVNTSAFDSHDATTSHVTGSPDAWLSGSPTSTPASSASSAPTQSEYIEYSSPSFSFSSNPLVVDSTNSKVEQVSSTSSDVVGEIITFCTSIESSKQDTSSVSVIGVVSSEFSRTSGSAQNTTGAYHSVFESTPISILNTLASGISLESPEGTSMTSISSESSEHTPVPSVEIVIDNMSLKAVVEEVSEKRAESQTPINTSSEVTGLTNVSQAATDASVSQSKDSDGTNPEEQTRVHSTTEVESTSKTLATEAVSEPSISSITQLGSESTHKEFESLQVKSEIPESREEHNIRSDKTDVAFTQSQSLSATEIEGTQQTLDSSGAEANYDLLEEKTPEPSKVLNDDRDLTTPTDTLVSMQSDGESSILVPSEEVSLETGRQSMQSRGGPSQEAKGISSDDLKASIQRKELEVHVEVPTKSPSSSVGTVLSASEAQTPRDSLQEVVSEGHIEEIGLKTQTDFPAEPSMTSYGDLTKVEEPLVTSNGQLATAIEPSVSTYEQMTEVTDQAVFSSNGLAGAAELSSTADSELAKASKPSPATDTWSSQITVSVQINTTATSSGITEEPYADSRSDELPHSSGPPSSAIHDEF